MTASKGRDKDTALPVTIAGEVIAPGTTERVSVPIARLPSRTPLELPLTVVHGAAPGPRIWISAAVHGDELNGVEIIRRLLERRTLRDLRGTLLAVPVVNVHGFMNRARYLPDRRDLNRSFPGLERGSMASRLAFLFAQEVVARAQFAIDLHTGSQNRTNIPQIRGDLDEPEVLRLARAFRAPVILHATGPAGTLYEVTRPRGIPLLTYEGGEALRFDEPAIRAGLRGVIDVMRALGMLGPAKPHAVKAGAPPQVEPFVCRLRKWVRAPESGLVLCDIELGQVVHEGEHLAWIVDPFSGDRTEVLAPAAGVVIGRLLLPVVNEGDALIHLALTEATARVAEVIDRFGEAIATELTLDDMPTAPETVE